MSQVKDSKSMIAQLETVIDIDTEDHPEPIRVIRNGQWVTLSSEAEMTEDECRAAYVAIFNIYE